jgi:hypothetical protein
VKPHSLDRSFSLHPRLASRLLSRKTGLAAGAVLMVIVLGCMNISIGSFRRSEDGTFEQKGELRLASGCEQDVYYPIPFAHTPNVELSGDVDNCFLVEQKEDHFRIRNPGPFKCCPDWTARGVRCAPPAPVVITAPPITALPAPSPPVEAPPEKP